MLLYSFSFADVDRKVIQQKARIDKFLNNQCQERYEFQYRGKFSLVTKFYI